MWEPGAEKGAVSGSEGPTCVTGSISRYSASEQNWMRGPLTVPTATALLAHLLCQNTPQSTLCQRSVSIHAVGEMSLKKGFLLCMEYRCNQSLKPEALRGTSDSTLHSSPVGVLESAVSGRSGSGVELKLCLSDKLPGDARLPPKKQ